MTEASPFSSDRGSEEEMAARLRCRGWGCEAPETFRIDMDDAFRGIWKKAEPFTMVSMERGFAVYNAVRHVLKRSIPGDFAECGVWKGGCCLIMALTLLDGGIRDRTIWMYDTYEGMPPPGREDEIAASGQAASGRWHKGWWAVDTAAVGRNLERWGYPVHMFKMIKGDVCETLKSIVPPKLSLLRLDTDWYASTKQELEILYPRLSPGGILIIDDYGHFSGSRKAVDDYFAEDVKAPLLHRTDYTGRCGIKEA